MSSWVKVTRGQTQKPPAVDKRHRPGWIPRLLDINPYKPYEKSEYAVKDGYAKEFEEVNSFKELFGQQSKFSSGSDDYERYQYSRKDVDDQYSKDNRREKLYVQFYEQIHKEYTKERPSDCVIVAINKEQTEYATVIGHQLQDHGLVVEMIYLASESGLTRALQEVKNDGSPFCILVEQSNVALSSCTVIMLHESIKIHRNMPMADALTLVSNAFGNVFAEREQKERTEISHKAADLADDYLEREPYGTYTVPLGIRHLLFLLSEGKYVYREELNSISDYMKTRKNELEGFVEKPDPTAEVNNTLYPASILGGAGTATNTLSKPPPLLPTPSRTPLLGLAPLSQAKPALLGERPGSLIPVPGIAGPKGKPPPLLAAPPTKRPGLLGFAPHQPVKRPFAGEKSGLLPIPDGMESATDGRLEKPPVPLPLLMATDTSKRMRLLGPRKESTVRPPLITFNPWSLGSIPYDGGESSWRPSALGHVINSERLSGTNTEEPRKRKKTPSYLRNKSKRNKGRMKRFLASKTTTSMNITANTDPTAVETWNTEENHSRITDGAESNWRPSLLGHVINSERSSVLPLQHPRSAKPKPLMN